LHDAFAATFRPRPWIRPNDGFWKRLQTYEVEERVVNVVRYRAQDDPRYQKSLRKFNSAPIRTPSSNGSPQNAMSPGETPALTPVPVSAGIATPMLLRRLEAQATPRRHRRSRTVVEFEDQAQSLSEGTLTCRVMRAARLDRVETFLAVKEACLKNNY
jgi:hypothetical protein